MQIVKRCLSSKPMDYILFCLLIGALVLVSLVSSPARANQEITKPTPVPVSLPALPDGANLLFASTESVSLAALPVDSISPASSSLAPVTPTEHNVLAKWGNAPARSKDIQEQKVSGTDGGNQVGQSFLSPDGRWLATQTYFGPMPVVWLVDLQDRARPQMTHLVAEGFGVFMGWHPDSRHALYVAWDRDVSDPGLWIVDVSDGSHKRVDVQNLVAPEGLTAAAFSPDGKIIAYAKTDGMGSGSQIWFADMEKSPRLVWEDKLTVVSSVVWSSDGAKLAFTNLLDSPVPFAKAGLWYATANGKESKFLAVMDGGHGQTPVWSMDSQQLYFIARDNLNDPNADQMADALVSSVHSADIRTGKDQVLVPADGARQLDLTLTPDGDVVFASSRSGTLEIWAATAKGQLRQMTSGGGAKRYPLVVPPTRKP